MKAIYKLVYNRKNKLYRNGEGIIQIEIYLNGKRKYISTNIHVIPEDYDSKNSTIKNSHPNASELKSIAIK